MIFCRNSSIDVYNIIISDSNTTTNNITNNSIANNQSMTTNQSNNMAQNNTTDANLSPLDYYYYIDNLNYTTLEMSFLSVEREVTQALSQGVQIFLQILSVTPLVYFFLSFLMYFTLSSIYLFLNIKLPQDVFLTLQKSY